MAVPMTQTQAMEVVRELRAVERLIAAVDAMRLDPAAAPEWRYGAVALDDRARWLRYVLSLEHPMVVESAVDLVDAESATARSTRSEPAPLTMGPPKGARVH